jgi:subtilisin family serine protease
VIIKFKAHTAAAEQQAILRDLGATAVDDLPGIAAKHVHVAGRGVDDAIRRYRGHAKVDFIEPNYIYQAFVTPNDPRFSEMWGLENTGQLGGVPGADIHAPLAWSVTTGSANVRIAITDTGIDYNHPDLAPNVFVNPGETPGNGIDDDHNGYIDDVRGWDFANNDNDPFDDHFHGTHVSGTIGAIGNNGVGVVGVNWPCAAHAAQVPGLHRLGEHRRGGARGLLRDLHGRQGHQRELGRAAGPRRLCASRSSPRVIRARSSSRRPAIPDPTTTSSPPTRPATGSPT